MSAGIKLNAISKRQRSGPGWTTMSREHRVLANSVRMAIVVPRCCNSAYAPETQEIAMQDETAEDTVANDDAPSDSPFTEDEQLMITMLPSLVGSAVAFSSKNGPVGTMKEMMANAKAALEGVKSYPNNKLIASVLPNLDDRAEALEQAKAMRAKQIERIQAAGINSPEDMKAKAIEDAAAVNALLDAKADSADAAEYRAWVLSVATGVAKAAKEGGFLGFGGEEVSEGETETIAQISAALGA